MGDDSSGSDTDDTIYTVVVNLEQQYSIWPADRELPAGWRDVGRSGSRQRLPGRHRGGLDGHAPVESAPCDPGRAAYLSRMFSLRCGCPLRVTGLVRVRPSLARALTL